MFRSLTVVCLLLGANALEPNCVNYMPNRFEYEHNVIEKLVILEQFKSETAEKIQALEQQVQAVNTNAQHQMLSTYVHWGMKTCPNVTGTTQVYTGQAAGGHYSHTGSGEYICLPNDPEYDQNNGVADTSRSLIYGAEYETSAAPALSDLYEKDVPCSLCLARGRTTVMLPGRTSCYSGWNREYQGYLMGENYQHQGKGYVCMDKNAEPLPSSVANLNGALFYMVEGRCGTLNCPPYVEGREIACVVCSIST